MKDIQLGEVGLQLSLWVKSGGNTLNISTATVKKLRITDPVKVNIMQAVIEGQEMNK